MSKLQKKMMIRVGIGVLNVVVTNAVAAQAPEVQREPQPGPVEIQVPQQLLPEPSPRPAAPRLLSGATAQAEAGDEAEGPDGKATSSAVATIVVDSDVRRPADEPWEAPPRSDEDRDRVHGLRLGYMAILNYDEPTDQGDPGSSPKEALDLKSPHTFLLGYEIAQRITGGGWLDVLLITNGTVAGLEQSKFLPNGNLLIGFEFRKSFQAGVGVNLAPIEEKPAHMIVAAGWTATAGELLLPIHVFMIPDVDSNHRIGATVGVNWEL